MQAEINKLTVTLRQKIARFLFVSAATLVWVLLPAKQTWAQG